jgi:hypothetical protein
MAQELPATATRRPAPGGQHPDCQHPDGQRRPDGRRHSGPEVEEAGGGLWIDRTEVHQATGMMLAQLAVSAHDAFVRRRAYAFAHQHPPAEAARNVLARHLVFTGDMG